MIKMQITTIAHHNRSFNTKLDCTQYYHCSAETNCHTETLTIPTPPTSQQPTTSNLTINSLLRFSVVAVSVCKSVVPKKHEERDQDLRDCSVNWMDATVHGSLGIIIVNFYIQDDNCGMECNYTAIISFYIMITIVHVQVVHRTQNCTWSQLLPLGR